MRRLLPATGLGCRLAVPHYDSVSLRDTLFSVSEMHRMPWAREAHADGMAACVPGLLGGRLGSVMAVPAHCTFSRRDGMDDGHRYQHRRSYISWLSSVGKYLIA